MSGAGLSSLINLKRGRGVLPRLRFGVCSIVLIFEPHHPGSRGPFASQVTSPLPCNPSLSPFFAPNIPYLLHHVRCPSPRAKPTPRACKDRSTSPDSGSGSRSRCLLIVARANSPLSLGPVSPEPACSSSPPSSSCGREKAERTPAPRQWSGSKKDRAFGRDRPLPAPRASRRAAAAAAAAGPEVPAAAPGVEGALVVDAVESTSCMRMGCTTCLVACHPARWANARGLHQDTASIAFESLISGQDERVRRRKGQQRQR